jgi:hypothetical protein
MLLILTFNLETVLGSKYFCLRFSVVKTATHKTKVNFCVFSNKDYNDKQFCIRAT